MIEKWKILKRETYRHSPYRAIEDVTFEMPNGDERVYSLKKEGEVVAILALDENKNVILAKQYRPGPDKVLDEIPGGRVDSGEDPLDAAKRELKEETGYESDNWTKLGTPIDCAYSTIVRHAYLATECKKTCEPQLDATEYIELVLKPIEDFFDQLKLGESTDCEVGWMGLNHLNFFKD